MKIVRTFGIVLAIHVVGGLLFFQPGCNTQSRPQASDTAPRTGQPMERLDWETQDSFAESDRARSSPGRPADGTSMRPLDEPTLRPLPGIEPAPRVSEPAGTYTVRAGDSLWVIANRHNVSLSALLSANGLTENSVIQPGQELRLPAGASASSTASRPGASSAPAGTTTYKVRSGDSLSVIAQRHNTTVANLKSLNSMTGDVIRVDQSLIVPAGGTAPRQAQATAGPAPSGDGKRHTVKSGETLGGIAQTYGVSVNDLMSANGISDPRRLQISQVLVIPGTEKPSAAPKPAPAPAPKPVAADEELPLLPADDDGDFPIIPILPNN